MVPKMVKQITFSGIFRFSGFDKKGKTKFKNAHTRILRGGGHPLYMYVASVGIAMHPQITGRWCRMRWQADAPQHFPAAGMSPMSSSSFTHHGPDREPTFL